MYNIVSLFDVQYIHWDQRYQGTQHISFSLVYQENNLCIHNMYINIIIQKWHVMVQISCVYTKRIQRLSWVGS